MVVPDSPSPYLVYNIAISKSSETADSDPPQRPLRIIVPFPSEALSESCINTHDQSFIHKPFQQVSSQPESPSPSQSLWERETLAGRGRLTGRGSVSPLPAIVSFSQPESPSPSQSPPPSQSLPLPARASPSQPDPRKYGDMPDKSVIFCIWF